MSKVSNPYKVILLGYICIALKILNHILFQVIGLLGYLLICAGLWNLKESRKIRLAAMSSLGIFLLAGFEFMKKPVTALSSMSFIIALFQVILYLILNWIILYFMFEYICDRMKEKNLVEDAKICMKKKNLFMNLLFYSVLCQNMAFMFGRFGAVLFLIGIGLTIYLSITEVVYIRKVSNLIQI